MIQVPAGWKPGKQLACGQHGLLPGRPLTLPDAQILWLSHLRDIHEDERAGKLAARLLRSGRVVTTAVAR